MSGPTVFISYSHYDEAWKNQLVSQLRVLEIEGVLSVWDDRKIAAGDGWRTEIETAMEHARAAVLLISADFLISEFIRGTEVPRLLQRRAQDGLRIIPLIVRPCPWRRVPWLAEIQGRPSDGRPLARAARPGRGGPLRARRRGIAGMCSRPGGWGTLGPRASRPPRFPSTVALPPAQRRPESVEGGRDARGPREKPLPLSTSAACPSPARSSSAGTRRSRGWMRPGRTRPFTSSPWWPSAASASRRLSPAGWTAWQLTVGAAPCGCSTGRFTAKGVKTKILPPSRSSTTPSASSAIPTPRPAPYTTAAPASPL